MLLEEKIERIELFALACQVDGGPISSLADMPIRNGLLIKLTAKDGAYGWGEAWCNYPPRGNRARLELLRDPIGPTLMKKERIQWPNLREELEIELARMVIHTGEPGPFNHCLAGLDMAMADLFARRAGISLSRLLGANATQRVNVYASSPGVGEVDTLAARLHKAGHTGVKIKVGFDLERDKDVLSRFRKGDAHNMMLCVDANQNWEGQGARDAINALEEYNLAFVEEAIRADASEEAWVSLARDVSVPLAAGENIPSFEKFKEHVDNNSLGVIQPDVAKWGGISGVVKSGKYARENGSGCTLHYMGTALGLAASLHTLAAIGGDGRVELDFNPNPLRTDLGDLVVQPENGTLPLPSGAGIGFEPDPEALHRFCVLKEDIH
ncbi:mandelate racemase/muconate lactonizing enzyme family protein [Polycladidibacter hongkongensis]|uniref:mandelate racemase/muconate lactonizing enzyme family protein n=1 Tax=Polycladidibacter hongkongensis TaxID=1647556 RepID=UPI000833CDFD|nr:mandelate racemase/muconate lactonizing enzyme family protein [Pseudovibrio hongkongensis]